MRFKKKFYSFMLLALCYLISCQPKAVKMQTDQAGLMLSLFEEKFKNVIKNANSKIDVSIELSHRDGIYLEGDEPYLYITLNRQAHVRLLYITSSGVILQKFPPLLYKPNTDSLIWVSDYFDKDVSQRIPAANFPFRYRVTMPPELDRAQEMVLAIASSVPFGKIDSLIQSKKIVQPEKYETSVIAGAVDLGLMFLPQANLIRVGSKMIYQSSTVLPKVFDLFSSVFATRKNRYEFGYNYKVITITR